MTTSGYRGGLVLFILTWTCSIVFCQLVRDTDMSCGDIVCPGNGVTYSCRVPADGHAVVWRITPQCERGKRDITHLPNDPPSDYSCDNGRNIEVQGMPDNTAYVSLLNMTNVTVSTTVECLFDNGTEMSIGITDIVTTAPTPIIIHNSTNNQVQKFYWKQELEKCPLVQYIVSGSAPCGKCVQSGNRYTCTDHSIGMKCTVKIMIRLCEIVVNESMLIINISSLSTTETSPTTSRTQEGIIIGFSIAAVIICLTILLIIVCICYYRKHTSVRRKRLKATENSGHNTIVKYNRKGQSNIDGTNAEESVEVLTGKSHSPAKGTQAAAGHGKPPSAEKSDSPNEETQGSDESSDKNVLVVANIIKPPGHKKAKENSGNEMTQNRNGLSGGIQNSSKTADEHDKVSVEESPSPNSEEPQDKVSTEESEAQTDQESALSSDKSHLLVPSFNSLRSKREPSVPYVSATRTVQPFHSPPCDDSYPAQKETVAQSVDIQVGASLEERLLAGFKDMIDEKLDKCASKEKVDKLEKEVRDLKREVSQLKAELLKKKNQLAHLEQEKEQLSSENEALIEENSKDKDLIKQLKKEIKELKEELDRKNRILLEKDSPNT